MITETIFALILFFMIVCLIAAIKFQNVALGAFTIILCLILAYNSFPIIGGIQYPSGALINSSSSITVITDTTSNFTNTFLGMLFVITGLYMALNIITFRKNQKQTDAESIE